jgi:hypothetical protein
MIKSLPDLDGGRGRRIGTGMTQELPGRSVIFRSLAHDPGRGHASGAARKPCRDGDRCS